MDIDSILSEQDKSKLNQFVNDDKMVKAVQKVLLANIYFEGTIRKEGIVIKNFALDLVRGDRSNKEIGADLRAAAKAVQLLSSGFTKLLQFGKKEMPKEQKKNPAR